MRKKKRRRSKTENMKKDNNKIKYSVEKKPPETINLLLFMVKIKTFFLKFMHIQ